MNIKNFEIYSNKFRYQYEISSSSTRQADASSGKSSSSEYLWTTDSSELTQHRRWHHHILGHPTYQFVHSLNTSFVLGLETGFRFSGHAQDLHETLLYRTHCSCCQNPVKGHSGLYSHPRLFLRVWTSSWNWYRYSRSGNRYLKEDVSNGDDYHAHNSTRSSYCELPTFSRLMGWR